MSRPKSTGRLCLNDRLKFGKHKGEIVRDAMIEDPNWFHWALDKIEDFELSEDAYNFLPPPIEKDYGQYDDLGWGDFQH